MEDPATCLPPAILPVSVVKVCVPCSFSNTAVWPHGVKSNMACFDGWVPNSSYIKLGNGWQCFPPYLSQLNPLCTAAAWTRVWTKDGRMGISINARNAAWTLCAASFLCSTRLLRNTVPDHAHHHCGDHACGHDHANSQDGDHKFVHDNPTNPSMVVT
eukprot:scaffold83610_cov21-Tisochrysis_lutea.AAC.1